MALILVRIEDPMSLLLNEFYDYNGFCYAVSRSRQSREEICINLDDIYEGTIEDTHVSGLPVVFVSTDAEQMPVILGWYREAVVHQKLLRPTLFLEGNIRASIRDAVLLPEDKRALYQSILTDSPWAVSSRCYEIIEKEDYRYAPLMSMISNYQGENACIPAHSTKVSIDPKSRKQYSRCISQCELYAGALMENRIRDIRDILLLKAYGEEAVRYGARNTDGYYYLAMADYQLGLIKDGLKAINKALTLEPEAADLMAVKAQLLCAFGHYTESAELFHKAYEDASEEDYLLEEGRVWMLAGQVEQGYHCFEQITDKELLAAAGIELRDFEKKWPFVKARGFHLKQFFRNFRRQ